MPTIRQLSNPLLEARVARLRDQELDWQLTVEDLAYEILTREAQLGDALRQLRETRRQVRQLLHGGACNGAAA